MGRASLYKQEKISANKKRNIFRFRTNNLNKLELDAITPKSQTGTRILFICIDKLTRHVNLFQYKLHRACARVIIHSQTNR